MAPALLNPAAATIIAVGLVGYGLMKLLSDDGADDAKEEVAGWTEPQSRDSTVGTVEKPLENRLEQPSVVSKAPLERIQDTASEPFDAALQETERSQESDAARHEMIRKYMSELGKRSAASRAKKRASDDQTRLD